MTGQSAPCEWIVVPELIGCSSLEIAQKNSYYVYTKKLDEIVRAQELATPSELTHLKRWLIAAMPEDGSYDKRIAQISDRLNLITEPPSISITLLLDNSGSMGARKL
jgi:cobalamin biosynthesis protein CobT